MRRVGDLTVGYLSRVAVWSCFAIYLGLFVFNIATRIGRFSPDSMNYVNVARNIAEGDGITHRRLAEYLEKLPHLLENPALLMV